MHIGKANYSAILRKKRNHVLLQDKSTEPDLNQRPRDIWFCLGSTVSRSTNWAIGGCVFVRKVSPYSNEIEITKHPSIITIGNHKKDIFMSLHGFRNTNFVRGISSSGRALDLHSRGTGIDTRILQFWKMLSRSNKPLRRCNMHHPSLLNRVVAHIQVAFDF